MPFLSRDDPAAHPLCSNPACAGSDLITLDPNTDTLTCHRCGGTRPNGANTWEWTCMDCGKAVQPGELHGLFIPHLCQPCLDARVARDLARGSICRLCGRVRTLCCC